MSEKSPEDPESRYVDKRFNNIIEREFNDAVAELDPSY